MINNPKIARIFLVLLIITSFLVFFTQYTLGDLPTNLNYIFDGMKFFLAILIGIIFEELITFEKLPEDLRRFAVSAFRRISDISLSIHRLKKELVQLRMNHSQKQLHELDLVSARVEEIEQQIHSSEDDWKDFLSEKISALDEIEKKKEEIKEIITSSRSLDKKETQKDINKLENEIEKLLRPLPATLQNIVRPEKIGNLPRDGRYSNFVALNLANNIEENGFLRILVGSRRSNFTEDRIEQIKNSSPYRYSTEAGMSQLYLSISGYDGTEFGLIENPFDEIHYKDYYVTLMEFFPKSDDVIRLDNELPKRLIPHSEFDRLAKEVSDHHFYIKIYQ